MVDLGIVGSFACLFAALALKMIDCFVHGIPWSADEARFKERFSECQLCGFITTNSDGGSTLQTVFVDGAVMCSWCFQDVRDRLTWATVYCLHCCQAMSRFEDSWECGDCCAAAVELDERSAAVG